MGHETGASASTPDAAAPAAAEASTLAVEGLPVDSLREAIPYLRRPFTPEAVKFKVQTVFKDAKGCIVVAYIDARLVIERLNLVVPDMWAARYEPIDDTKLAWCHLTIGRERESTSDNPFDSPSPGVVVTRSDVGEGQGMSDGQKYKATVSDALKRAAVHFGIGVSVYALPQITLYANQPHVEKRRTSKGETLALTELGHTKLREGYQGWLDKHGERLFGPALDHGDVQGATFDEETAEPEAFTPEPPAALDDDKARAFKDEINRAFNAIRAIDPAAITPGTFHGWIVGAQHSHEELEKLRDYLAQRLDGMQGEPA